LVVCDRSRNPLETVTDSAKRRDSTTFDECCGLESDFSGENRFATDGALSVTVRNAADTGLS